MRHLLLLLSAAFLLGGCLLVYDYGGYEQAGGGAAGGTGGTGGTGGGGQTCDTPENKVQECDQCIESNCVDNLADCSVSECKAWGVCFDGCECPSCFDACEEEPKGPPGEQVVQCVCNFCAVECAGVKPAEYLSSCE